MKTKLGLLLLILLITVGCDDSTQSEQPVEQPASQEVEQLSSREVEQLLLVSHGELGNKIFTITDEQAESLSKARELNLTGLISITDEQAESLSNVKTLIVSEANKKLIDKYKTQ